MAFNIPPMAFQSFSYKQALDSLWRLTLQWDALSWDHHDSAANREAFSSYLKILKDHENKQCQQLAFDLSECKLDEKRDLEKVLMILERRLEKDIPEQDFLISTQDTATEKRGDLPEVHLVLDNLRSSFNVGSLFRSAEAFGVTEIHLCGYTATPQNSKTAKSALGADEWVKWRHWDSTISCLEYLKGEKKACLYSFETCEESIPLREVEVKYPAALILGNERYGLAGPVLKRSDTLIEIPLAGRKNSLNVGVCGALAMESFLSL